MQRKLKISAESKAALRQFLAENEVDLGCRPVARREGDRTTTIGIADEAQVDQLVARASLGISIEILEAVPDTRSRLGLVSSGNRFLSGELPRGPGKKE
ncbi:hypothetical protein [Rhizobium azibense]|uniref:Uncharacterized protein n=1 Tax=Rhizobium azibense TaxID=1136135 RepID=A0A4R3RCF6_9HYPH|nr:hypothetical protein [Rhizobium azibense]TCU33128.1 hypothetical protein EV129_117125 [Rhizobium azibense]